MLSCSPLGLAHSRKNKHLLSSHWVPDPVLNTFCVLFPLILTKVPHFTDEEAKAHGEGVTCPKWEKAGLGCKCLGSCPRAGVEERFLE